MAGDTTTSASPRPVRDKYWPAVLGLFLVPIAIAAVCLASLPMRMTTLMISDDREFVMTGSHSPVVEEGADYRILSLRTGRTHRIHATGYVTFVGGTLHWREQIANRLHVKSLDLESFHETELGSIALDLYDEGICPLIAPDTVVMISKRNELCAINLRTGTVVSHDLPPLSATETHFWLPQWFEGSPPRLLLAEVANSASKGQDRMLLFSFADGKWEQLGAWTANMIPRVYDEKLFSLTIDRNLEVRRLSDGSLLTSHPLAEKLNLSKPAGVWPRTEWISEFDANRVAIGVLPNQQYIYDLERREIVFRHSSPTLRVRDLHDDLALLMEYQAVEVWKISDHSQVQRLDFSIPVYAAHFMEDGKRILVLGEDESVQIWDITTGKCLQTFRDRRWVTPTFAAMIFGAVAWTCLWVRGSVKRGTHPLVDLGVVYGLVLAGLLLRLSLQGTWRDPNRDVYTALQALGSSWLMLLMLWFVFSPHRWSIKMLLPLLGLASAIGFALLIFRGQRREIWNLLVGAMGMIGLLGAMLGLVRRWGWRLTSVALESRRNGQYSVSQRFPLRDVFFVTAAVGVLFAVMRFVPASQLDLQLAGILSLRAATTSLMAIVGAWAALSPHRVWFRYAVFLCILAFAGSIPSLLFPIWYNWYSWTWHLGFVAMAGFFTCGSLLIFRVRGWRLVRTPAVLIGIDSP